MTPCPRCQGIGSRRTTRYRYTTYVRCEDCEGTGNAPEYKPVPPARAKVFKSGGMVMVIRETQ